MDIGSQNSASQKTNVADNDILVEYLSVSFLHNTKRKWNIYFKIYILRTTHDSDSICLDPPISGAEVSVLVVLVNARITYVNSKAGIACMI